MTKGITISAGGSTYFLNAYLNIRLLRTKGCKLPISWFYMGDEMRPDWIEAVEEIPNVKTYNLGGSGDKTQMSGGYQSKVEAIVEAPFDEVLLIDADNFPVRNPEFLFDEEVYKRHGAVFWRDIRFFTDSEKSVLGDRYKINLENIYHLESGQLIFDKRKESVMNGLLMAREMNRDYKYTYECIFGDTDTFTIGFLRVGSPFIINPHPPRILKTGLMQKDFNGNDLFCHFAGGGKFKWHGRSLFLDDSELSGISSIPKIVSEMKQRKLHIK